jgi:peptidoglycan/xylan/chitin deacetylase (PgdA/CDA1 family)
MRSVVILNYHQIGIAPKRSRYKNHYVSPAFLRFQVRAVKLLGYEFTTLSNALAAKDGNWACITFDDGYKDNHEAALPVLREEGVVANVFLATNYINKNNIAFIEGGETLPKSFMNWEQVNELATEGWEIGSHCSDHVHLSRQEASKQEQLIAQSVDAVQTKTNILTKTFAYPYGDYTAQTINALRNLGFEYAVSNKFGVVHKDVDPYQLPRVSFKGQSIRHLGQNVKLLVRLLFAKVKPVKTMKDPSAPKPSAAPKTYQKIVQLLGQPKAGKKLLDCPCGEGALAKMLIEKGHQITVGDYFPEKYKLGQAHKVDLNGPIPFATEEFDTVVCADGLCELSHVTGATKELNRVLKADGKLIVAVANVLNLRSRFRFFATGFYSKYEAPFKETSYQTTTRILPYWELRYILSQSGFKLSKVTTNRMKGADLWWMPLWPIVAFFTYFVLYTKAKNSEQRRLNMEVAKHMLHPSLAFGETLIIEAVKK